MKIVISITLLLLTLPLSSQAKKFKGFIVNTTGDTTECTFSYNGAWRPYKIQGEILSRVKLKPIINGQKMSYDPSQLISYGILLNGKWKYYESINSQTIGYRFAKRQVSGKLNLFTFHTYDDLKYEYTYHIVVEDSSTKNTTYFPESCVGCRKKVIKYFSHCPEIAKKIESKIYRVGNRKTWIPLIKDYNNTCDSSSVCVLTNRWQHC